MEIFINNIFKIWFKLPEKLRFILVGGYNTVFSYATFCLFNFLFSHKVHYLLILAISHFIAVFHSFINFRFFVFRSKGHFWHEYLRVNLVYLGYFFCNAALLYALKELLGMNIFTAQLICILTLVAATYFLHKNFSFKQRDIAKFF
jgi:putative flippase GtrA